ncbi:MAG: hypothetical protein AAGU19_11315, partial [Prolixibacteraceae bacterium]
NTQKHLFFPIPPPHQTPPLNHSVLQHEKKLHRAKGTEHRAWSKTSVKTQDRRITDCRKSTLQPWNIETFRPLPVYRLRFPPCVMA